MSVRRRRCTDQARTRETSSGTRSGDTPRSSAPGRTGAWTEATVVVLLGCEEQLLPSWQSISSLDPEAAAEERRLFYVAATRAKDQLVLTHVQVRGRRETAAPSRFLVEAGLMEPSRRRWAA
jgi:hypothetical protein